MILQKKHKPKNVRGNIPNVQTIRYGESERVWERARESENWWRITRLDEVIFDYRTQPERKGGEENVQAKARTDERTALSFVYNIWMGVCVCDMGDYNIIMFCMSKSRANKQYTYTKQRESWGDLEFRLFYLIIMAKTTTPANESTEHGVCVWVCVYVCCCFFPSSFSSILLICFSSLRYVLSMYL